LKMVGATQMAEPNLEMVELYLEMVDATDG
jgi:hypothetical protein